MGEGLEQLWPLPCEVSILPLGQTSGLADLQVPAGARCSQPRTGVWEAQGQLGRPLSRAAAAAVRSGPAQLPGLATAAWVTLSPFLL